MKDAVLLAYLRTFLETYEHYYSVLFAMGSWWESCDLIFIFFRVISPALGNFRAIVNYPGASKVIEKDLGKIGVYKVGHNNS